MNDRLLRSIAIVLGTLSAGLAVASVALIVLSPSTVSIEDWGFPGYDAAFALVFAAVGLLVTTRRPGNVIGWLFLVAAMTSGLQTVSASYASYAIGAGGAGVGLARWITEWIWIPSLGTIILALLLFPNGLPASPRWRAPLVALVPVTAVATLLWAIAPVTTNVSDHDLNPLGLPEEHPLRTASLLSLFVLAAWFVGAAVSLWSRMRRGNAIERQQIKWIAYATALLGPAFAAGAATSVVPVDFAVEKASQVLAIGAVLFIPIAAAIAVLRHRLYDIDLLIKRTLVYGATSAAIAVCFFLGVVALQPFLRPITSGSELTVAASTLLSFGLFQPVRRRVQDAVDRRFDRSRYDAARTLESFADRLRDEVDLDTLRADLVDAVNRTMGPAHASVWLRERGR
jgi:hypothetical protein